jgi:predicted ATPase
VNVLTRLRVQGFKNLLDVDVRFGPFTCIAGPNGAGKSNLFDAIRFLHLLTQHPIMEAVQRVRETKGRSAEPRSLFTTFEGYTAREIRLTAELIVDRKVQDDFGVSATAAISTLRYEVAFGVRTEDGVERLVLTEEKLDPIPLHDAQDVFAFPKQKSFVKSCISGRRVVPFISTNTEGSEPEIRVHQEGHGGHGLHGLRLLAAKSAKTVISGMAWSDFPTVLAVHREMQSWQTLLLEPSAMRDLSRYQDARFIDPRGGNLPGTIFRLQKNETSPGSTYTELANRLSELIDDVQELQVRDDPKTEKLTLEVKGRNGVFHPARSLSDGTLRFLVLATLAQDPLARGVICLEEPENGIHPERIPAMVRLLKDIATDTKYAIGPENPLRQVIVNTHSPELFGNVSPAEDFVYVDEERTRVDGVEGRVASILVPPKSWRATCPGTEGRLVPGKVWAYLGLAAPTEHKQTWFDFAQNGPTA